MSENMMLVLLQGIAENDAKALETATRYRNCPYVKVMATSKNHLFAVYVIPEAQKWWIQYIQSHPEETLRLRDVSLVFTDHVTSPERPELPPDTGRETTAPCGSRCVTCPSYSKCLGCPSTLWHKRT